ncbi:hypothetical protein [Streptosporangium sp. NPDC002721]|uniref:hypothetical protein n=1 Tax=Streptosporangium sp. NPDC002721 TaxID=3366188 RepID=UPI00369FE340
MPGHRSPLTAVAVMTLVVRRTAGESTAFVPPRRNGSLVAGTNPTFDPITGDSATTPRSPAPDHREERHR